MNKKEKRKIIFLFAGILTAMIIFGIVLILIEKRMPEETISDASFLQENPDREEEEKALGSVKIGGKTYDYFHEYETYLVIGKPLSYEECVGNGSRTKKEIAEYIFSKVCEPFATPFGDMKNYDKNR